MKNLNSIILMSLLTFTATSNAESTEGAEKSKKRTSPLHRIFDTNKDGVIDTNEINDATSSLNNLDKTQDGQIDKADFEILKEEMKEKRAELGLEGKKRHGKKAMCDKRGKGKFKGKFKGKHDHSGKFEAKDTNQDGQLDSTEVDEKFLTHFDTNGDGFVTNAEIKAKMQSRKGRR